MFQNKILRIITKSPWFLRNSQIRRELEIDTIQEYVTQATFKCLRRMFKQDSLKELTEQTINRRLRPRLAQDFLNFP